MKIRVPKAPDYWTDCEADAWRDGYIVSKADSSDWWVDANIRTPQEDGLYAVQWPDGLITSLELDDVENGIDSQICRWIPVVIDHHELDATPNVAKINWQAQIMEAEKYGISDGYGEVGKGFVCPKCEKKNEFIDEDCADFLCENCEQQIKIL